MDYRSTLFSTAARARVDRNRMRRQVGQQVFVSNIDVVVGIHATIIAAPAHHRRPMIVLYVLRCVTTRVRELVRELVRARGSFVLARVAHILGVGPTSHIDSN